MADAAQSIEAKAVAPLAVPVWARSLTFVAAAFLSAFLLFLVQPMVARLALPRFGGAASVWALTLVTFQVLLLAGYALAHLMMTRLGTKGALIAQLLLLGLAFASLPVSLPVVGDSGPTMALLASLFVGIGAPVLALSVHAPLLQAWHRGQDPYRLYVASNAGSLLALLSYPTIVETNLGLATQIQAWGVGLGALTLLVALAGLSSQPQAAPRATVSAGHRAIAIWMALSAIASGLVVAATTAITTDLIAAPLIWVLPLALFLISAMAAFTGRRRLPDETILILLASLVMTSLIMPGRWARAVVVLATLFVACLALHRSLYRLRPAPEALTMFYLAMAAGGAAGGLITALAAPLLFTATFELQILLVLALLAAPGLWVGLDTERGSGLTCIALAAVIGVWIARELGGAGAERIAMLALIGAIGLAIVASRARADQRLVFVLGVGAIALTFGDGLPSVFAARSFYGTTRVVEDDGRRLMVHGTTVHGARRLRDKDGRAITQPAPATYYHPAAPLARGVEAARQAKRAGATPDTGAPQAAISMGLVGLGTGSLACMLQDGETLRAFELDAVVIDVAQRLFDFIPGCAPGAVIVPGDARMSLARDPDGSFDYLVVDAFSSDAVPTHLLTRQAFDLYLSKLSETGVLAVHVTNTVLDLESVVARTLDSETSALIVRYKAAPEHLDANDSTVIFVARHPALLDGVAAWPDAEGLRRPPGRGWSDDRAPVLPALLPFKR